MSFFKKEETLFTLGVFLRSLIGLTAESIDDGEIVERRDEDIIIITNFDK